MSMRTPLRSLVANVIAAIVLLLPALAGAQTGTLAPAPFQTFLDNSGKVVNGGCVWTYVAGTTTLATTYADVNLGTPNANPLKADAYGRFTAYLAPGSAYKFIYENVPCTSISHGSVLKTVDNIGAVPVASLNVDVTGIAGEALTAGQVVFLSDGSSGKTAGQWFLATSAANAYAGLIGMTTSAVTSGSTGQFRLAGRVTGLSVTAGSKYYVGSASGAILTPAPTNNGRFLGMADSNTSLVLSPDSASVSPLSLPLPGGRLTATSGTAVTTGDVSAATSIYYTPHVSNVLPLYDGAAWHLRVFSELTISISACTASNAYDVFAYDNAGTPTIETLIWTNSTTRATALVKQDGRWVKSGAVTRLYLGSYYCNASGGQTDDSAVKRSVFNAYNRVERGLLRLDATASWTYTVATWRQAHADTANQVDVMVGLAEDVVDVMLMVNAVNSGGGVRYGVAVGEDSTTAPASDGLRQFGTGTVQSQINARLTHIPAVGRHYYAWLEKSEATNTTTWTGVDSFGTQAGIVGRWRS